MTGVDSYQEWCDFTFPADSYTDLLDNENLRLGLDDLLGIRNGIFFEDLRSLLKTNSWILNDGDSDLKLEDALYLLKFGQINTIKTINQFSGNSGVSFSSHNLADTGEWPSGESKFIVEPTEGRYLLLTGSKILVDENFIAASPMFFRISAGGVTIREDVYENLTQLLLGAYSVNTSPKIGDTLNYGTLALVHIRYKYTEAIPLYSSLGMKLEIGFLENTAPKSAGSVLKLRIEGISLKNN